MEMLRGVQAGGRKSRDTEWGCSWEDAAQGRGAGEGSALCHPCPQQEQGPQEQPMAAPECCRAGQAAGNADSRNFGGGLLNSAWKRRARSDWSCVGRAQ